MSAAALPAPAPPAADAERSQRLPLLRVVVLAAAGASAALLLGSPQPAAPGPRALTSPATLLAAFDTLWLLLLFGRASLAGRGVLLAAGLPFHVAASAASAQGPGHGIATAMVLLAWAAVASVPTPRGALPGVALALATAGLPLAGYAIAEFTGAPLGRLLLQASPLTAPTMLLHRAAVEGAAAALPAVATAGLVLCAEFLLARLPWRGRP